MKKQHVSSLVKAFSSQRILVLGDVMLDEYHWCDVSRISPEAPVPICKVERTTLVPGGAANVANNLKQLGCPAHLVGVVGMDSTGDKLRQCLEDAGINTDGLIHTDEKPTILKSRIVAGQQHVVRVDREDGQQLSRSTQNAILRYLETHLPNSGALLLSDYLKGTLNDSLLKRVIALAAQHKVPVIVDPKGANYTKYKGATLLTPNFKEFRDVTKKECENEKIIEDEANRLIKRLQLTALLVTRSEKGMSLLDEKGVKHDIATQAQEVYDITGAGDTVISVLTAVIAAGGSFIDAAKLANAAAGVVVAKIGTSTITPDELLHAAESSHGK